MKSQKWVLALAAACTLALALAGSGCIFSPTPGGGGTTAKYLPPITPYAVIQNLTNLYINRDVQEYDATLSSDYVFKFVPDPITNAQDSLIRAEEYNFAEHLFVTGSTDGTEKPASIIKLTIDTTSSSPDNRIGHVGWIKYVVQTNLSINLADGTSHTVNGPAVFFFKQEPAGSGTWKLAEWDDQPTSSAPAQPMKQALAVVPKGPTK